VALLARASNELQRTLGGEVPLTDAAEADVAAITAASAAAVTGATGAVVGGSAEVPLADATAAAVAAVTGATGAIVGGSAEAAIVGKPSVDPLQPQEASAGITMRARQRLRQLWEASGHRLRSAWAHAASFTSFSGTSANTSSTDSVVRRGLALLHFIPPPPPVMTPPVIGGGTKASALELGSWTRFALIISCCVAVFALCSGIVVSGTSGSSGNDSRNDPRLGQGVAQRTLQGAAHRGIRAVERWRRKPQLRRAGSLDSVREESETEA